MSARTLRRFALPAVAAAVLLTVAACSRAPADGQSDAQPVTAAENTSTTPTVEMARDAGRIARAIENEPSRADEILEQHGTTRAEFEDLVYRIALDSELSAAYEAARTGSSG